MAKTKKVNPDHNICLFIHPLLHANRLRTSNTKTNIAYFTEHVFHMWMSVAAQTLSLVHHMKAPVQQLHTYRHASDAGGSRICTALHILPPNLLSPSCHCFSHPAH